MEINLEIPDDQVACIEQWLETTQKEVVLDPLTGGHVAKRLYPGGAGEFIEAQVGIIVYNVLRQVPTPEMRQQLIAAKQADDAIKAAARPRRVLRDTGVSGA